METKNDIPGFKSRDLHCICSSKDEAIFFATGLISELRGQYGTSVAYFSTCGTAKEIEYWQNSQNGLTGALYAEELEDTDCDKLCEKIAEMVDTKSVSTIIIDRLEGLDIKNFEGGIRAKRSEIKTRLWLLAGDKNIRILLFCPKWKSTKCDVLYNPFTSILPQMNSEGNDDIIIDLKQFKNPEV